MDYHESENEESSLQVCTTASPVVVDEVAQLKLYVAKLQDDIQMANQVNEDLLLEIRMLKGNPVSIH